MLTSFSVCIIAHSFRLVKRVLLLFLIVERQQQYVRKFCMSPLTVPYNSTALRICQEVKGKKINVRNWVLRP
nr:MAG TPA_asm: hypothetical protein [Caudoviricetes sp.]